MGGNGGEIMKFVPPITLGLADFVPPHFFGGAHKNFPPRVPKNGGGVFPPRVLKNGGAKTVPPPIYGGKKASML